MTIKINEGKFKVFAQPKTGAAARLDNLTIKGDNKFLTNKPISHAAGFMPIHADILVENTLDIVPELDTIEDSSIESSGLSSSKVQKRLTDRGIDPARPNIIMTSNFKPLKFKSDPDETSPNECNRNLEGNNITKYSKTAVYRHM